MNLLISWYLLYFAHLIFTFFVLQASTEKSDKKNMECNVLKSIETNRPFHFSKQRMQTLTNLLREKKMVNIFFFLYTAYCSYNSMKSILKESGQQPSIHNAIPIFCELHHQVLDHQWMKECFSHSYFHSLKTQMFYISFLVGCHLTEQKQSNPNFFGHFQPKLGIWLPPETVLSILDHQLQEYSFLRRFQWK